ncbi:MAG: hypothetical protein H7070_15615 [Saprospiraceae bacterium]|nr:hypothetical protein [Pyrinomonadaceae bacterium]
MDILKGMGAVLAGLIFIVISHSLVDFILESLGVFPQPGEGYLVGWMAAVATVYRSVLVIAGAYITASLAPSNPMLHAVILGIIGTVAGTIAAIVTIPMDIAPAWYPIALAILGLPCTWLGGKLKAV